MLLTKDVASPKNHFKLSLFNRSGIRFTCAKLYLVCILLLILRLKKMLKGKEQKKSDGYCLSLLQPRRSDVHSQCTLLVRCSLSVRLSVWRALNHAFQCTRNGYKKALPYPKPSPVEFWLQYNQLQHHNDQGKRFMVSQRELSRDKLKLWAWKNTK